MYILATFVRKWFPDGPPSNSGYATYAPDLREYLWNLDTTKYVGLWRRERCYYCNGYPRNCPSCAVTATSRTFCDGGGYMTNVVALCELKPDTLDFFKEVEAKGFHKLNFNLFESLGNGAGQEIVQKIKAGYLIQKMSRNSNDWNNQRVPRQIKMKDSEYYGELTMKRDGPAPPLPQSAEEEVCISSPSGQD